MSRPYLTRRTVLVSGAALAVHSALGLPTGRMTHLPMARAHDMAEIITKYIAAELALSEHLVSDEMPLETLYRHVLAQEQGVEVRHVVDSVGSLGFRDTALTRSASSWPSKNSLTQGYPSKTWTKCVRSAISRRSSFHRSPTAPHWKRCPSAIQPSWSTRYRRAPMQCSRRRRSTICSRPCQASHGAVDGNS
jgi:hypothetical protein